MTDNNQRISDTQIEAICEHLWALLPNGATPNVYAVLDGARNKRIEPLLNNSTLEHACLYAGKLSYVLQRAAPHIVKLEKNHPLTHKLLRMGWGDSWGIFAICQPDITMVAMRNNCRRICKVESPEGKTFIFRYYDPRVLRTFLPTSDADGLTKILGPASVLVCENEQPNQLNHYTNNSGSLQLQSFNLDAM